MQASDLQATKLSQLSDCQQRVEESNMERQDVHLLGPFDVTLVDKNGKQFKAHRDVLSEASCFFEKLLQSDMKEDKEGVIRLEMLTESLMKEMLEFVYSGCVQVSSEEKARELITAADHLFLPNLKKIAGRFLERSMTISNCTSTYQFAETYRCDELVAKAKTFVESNFAAVAKSEEFLNLTSQEVQEWISSDEIVINAEEDIFGIILGWIAKERMSRIGKFEELFRHVRLIFVSLDFLLEELVTNDFVKENESCMNRVTQAMKWFDGSTSCDLPSPKSPRKIFESHVLVAYGQISVGCYLPGEDKWYQLPEKNVDGDVIQCDGKLYAISRCLKKAEYYEPLCERWTSLEWSNGSELVEKFQYMGMPVTCVLAANGEIYAVVSDAECLNDETALLKYSIESHSWHFRSFPFLDRKHGVCAVALDRNIYVVGGEGPGHRQANNAARYDTESNTWEEVALMQEGRSYALGAAANGRVYIAGGKGTDDKLLKSCEVYNEMINEWCVIASLTTPRYWGSMVCVDGKPYVLGGRTVCPPSYHHGLEKHRYAVEFYDRRKDKWRKTKRQMELPFWLGGDDGFSLDAYKACSARVFKGILKVESPGKPPPLRCSIT